MLLASEFNGWLSNPCIWLQIDDDTDHSERGPVEEKINPPCPLILHHMMNYVMCYLYICMICIFNDLVSV